MNWVTYRVRGWDSSPPVWNPADCAAWKCVRGLYPFESASVLPPLVFAAG